MRERDARYTLYFENVGLHMKLKELDGSSYTGDTGYGDPVVLRIALDRCRSVQLINFDLYVILLHIGAELYVE